MSRAEADALIRLIGRRCKGAKIDAVSRVPCGADVNDLLVELPWDGKEHTVKCKNCGQVISVRMPVL